MTTTRPRNNDNISRQSEDCDDVDDNWREEYYRRPERLDSDCKSRSEYPMDLGLLVALRSRRFGGFLSKQDACVS
jgi:hypothetical protein